MSHDQHGDRFADRCGQVGKVYADNRPCVLHGQVHTRGNLQGNSRGPA